MVDGSYLHMVTYPLVEVALLPFLLPSYFLCTTYFLSCYLLLSGIPYCIGNQAIYRTCARGNSW